MYRKVIENPYIRISIRRLKSKKRAKILGSRFAEAVPPAESLKALCKYTFYEMAVVMANFEITEARTGAVRAGVVARPSPLGGA